MITVLTGKPGNGKTSLMVMEIKRLIDEGRPVITVGIPHIKLPVIVWTRKQLLQWHLIDTNFVVSVNDDGEEDFPPLLHTPQGAAIFVDEGQKTWPLNGTKLSDDAWALSEHRHWGLDFWIASQSPRFLNKCVTENASKHIHIGKKWSGSKYYEWGDVQDNPESTTSKNDAFVRKYKPNPESFKLYESASVHTKIKYNIPRVAWFFGLVVIALGALSYRAYARVEDIKKNGLHHSNKTDNSQGDSVKSSNTSPQLVSTLSKPLYNKDDIAMIFNYEHDCIAYNDYFERLTVPRSDCVSLSKTSWIRKNKPVISKSETKHIQRDL